MENFVDDSNVSEVIVHETSYATFEWTDELEASLMHQFSKDSVYGKWITELAAFAKGDKKCMKITFSSKKERDSFRYSLRKFIKDNKLDWTIGNYGTGFQMYIVRS